MHCGCDNQRTNKDLKSRETEENSQERVNLSGKTQLKAVLISRKCLIEWMVHQGELFVTSVLRYWKDQEED